MLAKRVLAFVVVLAFAAVIAWLGGYDFDKRNPDVAFFVVMSAILAALIAACPYFDER